MKKILGTVVLSLLLSSSAYSDSITTFKCGFDKANYEYTINLYNEEINEVHITNMETKKTYHHNKFKKSADITVILGDKSYNFKGFKNNNYGTLDHHLFFSDRAASIYAYLAVTDDYKGGQPKHFYITSLDSALEYITKGKCEAFY